METENESSMLRGLFNDLTRTLFSSAIFLDDLHLHLQQDSEVFDSWWLANEQLKRAIEFFLELRSTCFWYLASLDLRDKGNRDGRFSEPKDPIVPQMGLSNSCTKVLDGKGGCSKGD